MLLLLFVYVCLQPYNYNKGRFDYFAQVVTRYTSLWLV